MSSPPGSETAGHGNRNHLGLTASLRAFAGDIKLAHSVFALPFAASAFILGDLPLPGIREILLLLVCMVTARSFAMGMNRYLDRKSDALNPRTSMRKIPAGILRPRESLFWSLVNGALFIAAAAAVNNLAGMLSAPLLLILASYPLLKRISWICHLYLGICLGLAPIAVAVAVSASVPVPVLLLGLAVTLWTAGFDILYSLQDLDFDRKQNLQSIPVRFGPATALLLSRGSFITAVVTLTIAGYLAGSGAIYYGGVALMAAILTWEHYVVRDARFDGKSANINAAFFNANAMVSILFFTAALADRLSA